MRTGSTFAVRFLVLFVFLLASSVVPATAGARDVPPRFDEPWPLAAERIRAEYLANPFRFPKREVVAFAPPVIAPAETAPASAVLVTWPCGSSYGPDAWDRMWMAIIGAAVKSSADAFVYLRSWDGDGPATTLARCSQMLAADQGIDPAKVTFLQGVPQDAFWMRDYGPLFTWDRATRSILSIEDPLYYPTRPLDDAIPQDFGARIGAPVSPLPVYYEGGNFLANGGGLCIASSVLKSRNPQYDQAELEALFANDLGCDRLVIVDALQDYATGHVDMWMAFADRDTLLVGEYAADQDPTNRAIIEANVASKLTGLTDPETGVAVEIVRVPMPSNCPGSPAPQSCPGVPLASRTWRTYLNVLPVNGKVLVPVYAADRTHETAALEAWVSAGLEPIAVPSDHIIGYAGSIHCITKSITAAPAPPAPPDPSPSPTPAANGGTTGSDGFDSLSGGCSVAGGRPGPPPWLALGLAALLVRRRRERFR